MIVALYEEIIITKPYLPGIIAILAAFVIFAILIYKIFVKWLEYKKQTQPTSDPLNEQQSSN